jgi:hypothetical protein
LTGRAGLLMYWRIASWGVVPAAYLVQLRDLVRLLAGGSSIELRQAGYLADRLGFDLFLRAAVVS